MALLSTRETGSPLGEGACGKIVETERAGIVVKRLHRRLKHGAKCLDARAQCAIQQWAAALLTPTNGFSVLFTPRAWMSVSLDQSARGVSEYAMERIHCDNESTVTASELPSESLELSELRLFYEKARAKGIYPCDYELYRQPDGRVAMIDFDKFSQWRQTPDGDEIVFPWGATTSEPVYPWTQREKE